MRAQTTLHRPWRASSLAWTGTAASLVLAMVALGMAVGGAVSSGQYQRLLSHQTFTPFITTGFAIVGALVASRHPRNPIGWMFVVVGLLYALVALLAVVIVYGPPAAPYQPWVHWLGAWLWLPALFLPAMFVPLVFPDGHLPAARWRAVPWVAALGLAITVLVVMLHPGPLAVLGLEANPLGIPGAVAVLDALFVLGAALLALGFAGSVAAFAVRFRRSAGLERQQMKWLVYAVALNVLGFGLSSAGWFFWPNHPWKAEISITLSNLSILGIAVAAGLAILRHRLYDLNLVINRTLVYGALTAAVAALYGLVVGGLGVLLRARGSVALSLAVVIITAIIAQPVRDRLQRAVNHLMYGDRDDPYAVLSKLGQRLEATFAPEAVLPTIVETVAQALKLPYAAIHWQQDGHEQIMAEYGCPAGELLRWPLAYQGVAVGELVLSPRAPGEAFGPADRRLLEDVARQAGVAVHAVGLTAALQRSRERLVTAREEERRRLRRDLHDGLGPQLASLTLNLETARNRLAHDPEAQALLGQLAARTQAAVADIRRLVYELRPPTLDELGLVQALRVSMAQYLQPRHSALRLTMEAPDQLPPLPAAVEVAAYRIAQEALTNVVRHAGAHHCRVHLALDPAGGWLCVEVQDDGQGLPAGFSSGVGLISMRERAEELGGTWTLEARQPHGTRVRVQLPCRVLAPDSLAA